MKKRIVFIGGEDISLRIPMIKSLIDLDFDVWVIGSEREELFESASIAYSVYSLNRRFSPLSDLFSFIRLVKLLKEIQADVVHTFDTKPNILGSFAAWLVGTPKIIKTINGMGKIFSYDSKFNSLLRIIYSFSQSLTNKISTYTIFQNSDDKQYFISKGMIESNKAIYVPGSGVSIDLINKSIKEEAELQSLRKSLQLENKITVILISRIIKAKGIIEYLESSALVKHHSKNVRFLLVGPIEGNEVSKADIQEYSDSCTYIGFRDDVSSLIFLSDVVVLPTYYKEGVPRCLIEGAALGKPLIATDASGCRDIVQNDENGILINTHDVIGLSDAILKLVKYPKLREEMGKKGIDLVNEKFSLANISASWASLYK